ncbi:tetratricopeptide repeat protein [Marinoscillum furvescens]|uniref:Tetratricopeptide repeat protein n=1 Tax=Marinoscillum furvescens DSM 4134 TaxID=1122208 RepID=A0A3D9L524_MARFU|nr:hypothetical protein [Marinoscillum furvescens]REE01092.1 tetratricopeptide repeat protein [Marinoscillum furvescens DSM 4134]
MKRPFLVFLAIIHYQMIVAQDFNLAFSLYKEGNPACKAIFFSALESDMPADSLHLSAYYLAGVYYAEDSVEQALIHAHKSLDLAFKSDEELHIMRAYMRLFQCYYKWNSFQEARNSAIKALKHAPDDHWKHRNQYNLALAYQKLNKMDSALWYFTENYDYYLAQKDTLQICKNLNEIGLIYFYLNDYPQAREYYFDLLDYSTHVGSTKYQGFALNNIGNAYKEEGMTDSAIAYLSRSIPFQSSRLAMHISYNLSRLVDDPYPHLIAAKDRFHSDLDSRDYKSILLDLRRYHTHPDSIHHYEALLADLVAEDLTKDQLIRAENARLKILEIERQIELRRRELQQQEERTIYQFIILATILVAIFASLYYTRRFFPEKIKERLKILSKQNAEYRNTMRQMLNK